MITIPMDMQAQLERSAESVTAGHPDKICDQIADSFVDLVLGSPEGTEGVRKCRMAAEVTGGHNEIYITGEMKGLGELIDFEHEAKKTAGHIYQEITGTGIDRVYFNMAMQSPEIAGKHEQCTGGADDGGAGDQGVMVGYATDETPEMLPHPFLLARKVSQAMYEAAMKKKLWWMKTDGKSEVVMKGDDILTLIIAIQHAEKASKEEIQADLIREIILPTLGVVPPNLIINGTGSFIRGGFEADAGTTGRKLVVDNYGPECPIGGGAYSGKDSTKVDRSAAYMARHIAKNIVAHKIGDARKALVQVAYVIGVAEPQAVLAITDTGKDVSGWVREKFSLKPSHIINSLNLWRPIYRQLCVNGHYGVDHTSEANKEKLEIWTWEKVRTDI